MKSAYCTLSSHSHRGNKWGNDYIRVSLNYMSYVCVTNKDFIDSSQHLFPDKISRLLWRRLAHLLWLRLVETHQWNRLIASGNKTLHCPTEPTHFHHYQLLKPPRTLKPNPFNGLRLEFWRLWLVFVFFVLWICGVGTRCYFRLVCMKRVVLRDELVHVNTEVGLGDMAEI